MTENNQRQILEKAWRTNLYNIKDSTESCIEKNLNKIYVGVELHETVFIPGTWDFYKGAKETLQLISSNKEFELIINSTYEHDFTQRVCAASLTPHGINPIGINMNPEIPTKSYKPILDVMIDKRSGFNTDMWGTTYYLCKLARERILDRFNNPSGVTKHPPIAYPVTTKRFKNKETSGTDTFINVSLDKNGFIDLSLFDDDK